MSPAVDTDESPVATLIDPDEDLAEAADWIVTDPLTAVSLDPLVNAIDPPFISTDDPPAMDTSPPADPPIDP
ncbi:hypothetical protein B484DRAFT_455534 [Ochromonadaceae sp. CCMP2298]|nr:hypothetical protein B484DRAFT_455534 [Ochromonadaceae sp. CCMP2298]